MLSKTLFRVWNIQELSVQIKTGPATCVHLEGLCHCGTVPPPLEGSTLHKNELKPRIVLEIRGAPVHHRPEIKNIQCSDQARRHSVLDEEQRAAFPSHPLS